MITPNQSTSTIQKPHILLLGSQMAVAGAQHVLLDQADWLAGLGYPVTVAFLYDRDGLMGKWQAGRKFPIIDLYFRSPGDGKLKKSLSFFRGLQNLYRLIRQEKFGVIETFTHHSNLIGCPLAWLAGVPVRIASHHGRIDRMPGWINRLHTWMVNCGIAQKMVVVSRDVYRQAQEDGIHEDRLSLILNGVIDHNGNPEKAATLRSEFLPDSNGKLILSVGSLTYQKAHTCMLQALPEILTRYPDLVYILAGDGPMRANLEAEISRLGIQNHVRILGVRPDVADLMLAADIFCLPSRSEGLPLVILEAMRAGLPILSTDVPGIRDTLNNGECGSIIPIEDPVALSNGIIGMLSDEDRCQKMGRAARARYEQNYTLDIMMSRYIELMKLNRPS